MELLVNLCSIDLFVHLNTQLCTHSYYHLNYSLLTFPPPGAVPILEGIVAMDGMQKAVAKNMEKTLSVPIFRVSR